MRHTVLITALLVLAVAAPAIADIEIGLSWTPIPATDQSSTDEFESITGFHLGYHWWGIFYVTWDSLMLPPDVIKGLTGITRPGFLNLYDAGLRLRIGPIIGYATVGVNSIYIYRQEELVNYDPSFGANMRLGAGLKFKWWGVNVSGTSVFPSFDHMVQTLAALGEESTRDIAIEKIVNGLIPSINLTLYF